MNPATKKTTALIGLTLVGAYVANRITRSKNNTVIWGINGQLDQMNSVADMGREAPEHPNRAPLNEKEERS